VSHRAKALTQTTRRHLPEGPVCDIQGTQYRDCRKGKAPPPSTFKPSLRILKIAMIAPRSNGKIEKKNLASVENNENAREVLGGKNSLHSKDKESKNDFSCPTILQLLWEISDTV